MVYHTTDIFATEVENLDLPIQVHSHQ